MVTEEIPTLIMYAVEQYPDIKEIYNAHARGQPVPGKAIGIGYDPSSSGFGRISVGVVSEDGVYHQHFGVTDRFGNDPDKVFAQQVAQLGPNMMDLIKFFVRGQEKDFKPKSAGLSRK